MPEKDKTGPFGEGKECDDPRGRNQGGKGFRDKGTGEGKGRGQKDQKKTTEAMLREKEAEKNKQ